MRSEARLHDDLQLAAHVDLAVLVTATKAGDRVVHAHFIHEHSARAHGPFIVLERRRNRRLRTAALQRAFEQAQGGTLCIEDIETLDAPAQVALMSLLESMNHPRVGGAATSGASDVRIIAGAGRSLYQAITSNGFSDCLYYRLNIIHIDCDQDW
jgi:two-component system response regulator FlrC